jgi:perosamine synthetase
MPTPAKIPVYAPSLEGNERRYVDECLDSNWISSRGAFVERFEEAFAGYIGAAHATTVSNGTVALHLAMAALGIGPGDEVIVPTLTYIASVNTIAQTGATPVFVDSLDTTWQIDPEAIRQATTPRTRAVMAVHLYGHPCDMSPIAAHCAERGLLLIEDCAEAFGSRYRGQHVGTFGDVATFSFFGNKTITTGEGGMVVSRDVELHRRCAKLKNQGVVDYRQYWHDEPAYNYRMTNVCAAIGLAQMERADEIIAKKQAIADWYAELLKDAPVTMNRAVGDVFHSYWMNCMLIPDADARDELREHLTRAGIETRPVFYPAHKLPMYYSPDRYPRAEAIGGRGINLPSGPALTREQIAQIGEEVSRFFRT